MQQRVPFRWNGVWQYGGLSPVTEAAGEEQAIADMPDERRKRKHSVTSWQTDQIVWWKGQAYDRQSDEYQKLIRRAYQAMFAQSERFRAALMQTRGITLIHSSGEANPYKTILTPQELCQILTEMRDNYDKRDNGIVHKKRVLVDVSGQLYEISPISQDYAVAPTDEVIQLESEKFPDWNSVLEYVNAEEL